MEQRSEMLVPSQTMRHKKPYSKTLKAFLTGGPIPIHFKELKHYLSQSFKTLLAMLSL